MANVNEGLSTDPNSEAGFLEALAGQAGGTVTDEQRQAATDTDRNVEAALETDADREQKRDESGRFVKDEPATPAAAEETPPSDEEAPADSENPELDALLEKYDGDAVAALAAIDKERREAQSLIGRQAAEVSESRQLREELAEMRGRMEEMSRARQQPTGDPFGNVTADTVDRLETLYAERGGIAMMSQLANRNASDDMIEAALEVWKEDEPFEAARFASRMDFIQQFGVAPEDAGAEETPAATQQQAQTPAVASPEQIAASVQAVKQTLGQEWVIVGKEVFPAFQEAHPSIQNMVVSEDPATREAGINTLAQLARARVISSARETPATAGATKGSTGIVAGGSNPPGRTPQRASGAAPTEEEREERIDAFRKEILSAETTSVADGFTYDR